MKRDVAMFGYVHVLKEELKIKEYDMFRAYYCGLCKTLKEEYGFSARLALNYDSVFLALLLSSITGNQITCSPERCIANPFRKRPVMKTEDCLSYSAGVMLTLACLKAEDNIHDEKSLRSIVAYIALLPARQKLYKKHGALYKACKENILSLSRLEKENCPAIDKVAHEFACITERVFVPPFIEDETTKRVLAHMGYLLGRLIYMLDAYEDSEADKQKKRYNPYLASGTLPSPEEFTESVTFTLSSLANDYELLTIQKNKSLLDNIIYLGLPNTLRRVANGLPAAAKGEQKYERSL